MANEQAVAVEEAIEDSASAATTDAGVEAGDSKRERSTIEFPYLDLDAAVEIAKSVYEIAGEKCEWNQLAAHLKQAPDGGGFRLKAMTAKMFGFVTYAQGIVSLTPLGKKLCDPNLEKAAKAEGFLTVPLYLKLYKDFDGMVLPPPDGLENAIANLGVALKQKGKARQAFQRSAMQAGFFWSGPNRLVKPVIKGNAASTTPVKDSHEETDKTKDKGDEEEPKPKQHSLIEGLIKALPPSGDDWPLAARRKWLQAAAVNFDFVYTDSAPTDSAIKVSIVREDSAN